MRLVKFFYTKFLKRRPPYYAEYSLLLILWKPIRKYINVVFIPNIPFNTLRVRLYRLIGFRIGKKVFIGMKCYLDDVDPAQTIIEDEVVISYGCYFACHGKGQSHTMIHIKKAAYIGMRCNIISGKQGISIGERAVIGAGSLINKHIPKERLAVGVPIRVLKVENK
jgi:acetyltransferase-like isoleucine patch superfamily enzyme